MQNKGAIRLFAILLSLACIYYLLFTVVSNRVEKNAQKYAKEYVTHPDIVQAAKAYAHNDMAKEKFYLDSVKLKRVDYYMDSIKNKPVYNIFITKFTYEDCKARGINLGLDLRGGMNVTLEISAPDIIRTMSNNSKDPVFNKALQIAEKEHERSTTDFVTLFGNAFERLAPNAKLAADFQTIELKDKINYNTSNADVLSLIRDRLKEALATSMKTLRVRIDKYGVTQPNIQELKGTGRILVELPGVSDKERVRKLLQGTANLEFWETYENSEIYPYLQKANDRLRDVLALKDSTKNGKSDSLSVKSKKVNGKKNNTKVAASKIDTTKKDTSSLAQQLQAQADTSKAGENNQDSAFFVKHNPLFAVLSPAIYRDNDGNYKYRPGPVVGFSRILDTAKVDKYLKDPRIKAIFPPRVKFLWSFKPMKGTQELQLVAIKVTSRDGKAPLYGDIITDARKQYERKGSGSPEIAMSMTAEAAQKWRILTKDNIGKSIAIVLDNNVYSFPTVQGEISGGQSSITGDFTIREADDLINILKAGKLPAPAHIVEETVVGPTLGKEAIHAGLLSMVIALITVLLFMGFYYNKAGWVADMALFANVFFIMGVLASLGAVLTLPGLAGIVLTIGMSVDANILIFERVREELAIGKGIGMAVKEGFKHAMPSVVDSNLTTLLLGIVLYIFGTGPIQGFATTLIIGILTSMFSAIFISRLIFERLLAKNKPIKFSNKFTENAFKNINIDFVSKRKYYYMFSGAIILSGIISVTQRGFNLGVDFQGGRTFVVRFDHAVPTQNVRKALAVKFGKQPEVITYGEKTQVKVTTTYMIDDNSKDAEQKVEQTLKSGLSSLHDHYQIMSSQLVGETVSQDIKSKALWSIFFACIIMFLYILIRFKKWQYGLGGVIALMHDAMVILSCFTLLHGFVPFSLEIDQAFIAAILTVMGYSINDTVVVFDRIREYLTTTHKKDIERTSRNEVINHALNSTLSRTINTSLTIFFVLLTIFLFGGETIKGFSFALLVGIVIGTYSSICIATPIVIDFDKKDKAKMLKK